MKNIKNSTNYDKRLAKQLMKNVKYATKILILSNVHAIRGLTLKKSNLKNIPDAPHMATYYNLNIINLNCVEIVSGYGRW